MVFFPSFFQRTPPPRPPPVRQQSPTMDPDEVRFSNLPNAFSYFLRVRFQALLAAIRLATDLDPNKQAEQVVLPNN